MISTRKIEVEKTRIVKECPRCGGSSCASCMRYCGFIDSMAAADIPVDYWFREMEKFHGHPRFKQEILAYIGALDEGFAKGGVLCLTGHRGTGKTMAACGILKKALLSGYTAHYTTLVDAVNTLMSHDSYAYRQKLRVWDFLVVDEVDQRYFDTVNSRNLYGNHFENLLRTRVHNKLPLIMCTNSGDPAQIFEGQFQESFRSLQSQFFMMLNAGGKDARKDKERHGATA